MKGTFTVAGQRVRTSSQRRYVAFRVNRRFDGVQYEPHTVASITIFKRSDSLPTLRQAIQRYGFSASCRYVVIDTETGAEVN
jgi:hypothetical protein